MILYVVTNHLGGRPPTDNVIDGISCLLHSYVVVFGCCFLLVVFLIITDTVLS